ncbi:MAG TPA: hypothetical protein VLG25_03185 [Patescibacteria group bacterium]|nr:hypothetical protein [Patescibacteria group bacterium]
MKTITICSSASFYKHVVELQEKLEKFGYNVIIPFTARRMKQDNNYDLAGYKPTLDEFERKAFLMRGHLDEVNKGDICLVVNNEKHGVPNYIGGNVLMEMCLAFYQHKPIVILNEIPKESTFLEEIVGMQPIVLHGKIENLSKELAALSKK